MATTITKQSAIADVLSWLKEKGLSEAVSDFQGKLFFL